jgi:site-specific recombinase XerC
MISHFLSQYTPASAKTNAIVLREATKFIRKPLHEATQEDVIAYQKFIDGQAANTRKRKLSTLSAYFNYLLKREAITKNPMIAIRIPKTDRLRTIKWLKEDEAALLLDSSAGQERAIIAAGLSGLRVSEIVSLNVDQVRDGRLWNVEGKGGKVRTVPLTTQAADAIETWAQKRRRGPLFTLKGGKRISTRSVQKMVARAATEALGRPIHPHALRHTFGTLGAKADIPVLKLGRILGHSNPAVTEIYVHLDDEDLMKEVRRLDRPLYHAKARKHLKLIQSA